MSSNDSPAMSSEHQILLAQTEHVAKTLGNPVFSMGDNLIDRQHQQLFEQLGTILFGPQANVGKEARLTMLEAHLQAERQHFQDEEAMMRRVGYRFLDEHAAAHERLLTTTTTLLARCGAGDIRIEDCVSDVALMLLEHILREDMRYKKDGA